MVEFKAHFGGTVLGVSDLRSDPEPGCLDGGGHDWKYSASERHCHYSFCTHVTCRACGIERVTYDIPLRDRPRLVEDLDACRIEYVIDPVGVPFFIGNDGKSVHVTRYVARADASTAAPTPA